MDGESVDRAKSFENESGDLTPYNARRTESLTLWQIAYGVRRYRPFTLPIFILTD